MLQDRKDVWQGTQDLHELASSADKLLLLANYDSPQATNLTKLLEYELVGYISISIVFNFE